MSKIVKILLVISGVLILANFSILNFFLVKDKFLNIEEKKNIGEKLISELTTGEETKTATDSCGLICRQTIKEEIEKELSKLPSSAGQSSVSPSVPRIVQPTKTNGKPKEVYIPLTTGGSTTAVTWEDILPSEFYFDLNNYQGYREIRFEVYLLSLNNDPGKVRIYDFTNKRAVDYSELQTTSSSFSRIESGAITIWRGNNKYTVQLRSANGTEVKLKDARLKIIY